jgi:uncharacterized damage-inducible protein DinB
MKPRTQATVDLIAGERRRFERFCRALSTDELRQPVPSSNWTVQDFIAHVATLDGAYLGWFAVLAGEPAHCPHRGSDDFAVDEYNATAVAERRGESVEALLTEAARRRAALIGALERLPEEALDRSIHFRGDSKRPPSDLLLERFLRGWARHDAIHVADMLKALPERRTDQAIAGWLEEPDVAEAVRNYARLMG